MKLRVLSRSRVEAYTPPPGAVCISVNERGMSYAHLADGYTAVLRLVFDDIDGEHGAGWIPFDAEHARKILDFIAEHRGASECVVHCTMGASRSPGIALGILDALGEDASGFEASFPLYNRRVRRKLAEAALGPSVAA